MDKTSWVAIDKKLASTFKDIGRRKYSDIEAMFSYSIDVNCGNIKSMRSYSRIWSWSTTKVSKFLNMHSEEVTLKRQQGNSKATPYSLILLNIDDNKKQKSNNGVTEKKHSIKEQEQEQETTKKHIGDFRPDWISVSLWKALIANRKFKKLQNTELALKTFTNSLQKGIDAGFDIETCIGEYVSTKWARFDHTWINGNGDKNGKLKIVGSGYSDARPKDWTK